jgi:hypothetical protein
MKEELSSSETLVLTRATRRNIPEDAILLLSVILEVFYKCSKQKFTKRIFYRISVYNILGKSLII